MPPESVHLGPVDFSTFIVSLASNVMVHLDESAELNLPLAKQTIDILSILQEKTTGNLTEDEEALLKSALYQVRMTYVERSQP